ncbi:hypothetical protein BOW28_06430 [Solemya velum gill symbiont]|uniref:V-type ATP synthase subunit D n=1 Tax=Solemya velum gill symbiont TaxID=2340 RepID=UPI0009D2B468|nr:V-type ATP synthase subunit D [Solemya velum gill symbiont]OOZ17413.1 hypothetical protein BOW28_06430 [Solemya velum gill symbiont]OOZ27058.1 hypothetical protein BOW32_05975 [Solemya velum gill symbiont]
MAVEFTPSQSAVLELRDEKSIVLEAYDFLDEKRLLLAAELLKQLEDFEKLSDRLEQQRHLCRSAMGSAVSRHGLHGVQLYPPAEIEAHLSREQRPFMGVTLAKSELDAEDAPDNLLVANPSPEAVDTGNEFRELFFLAAVLAGISGNLHRLMDEYQKTERRARALENVVIPEIEQLLVNMTAQLEEFDQEEIIRTHRGHQQAS